MMTKTPGFTKNQRLWFLERDWSRCSFITLGDGIWKRCEGRDDLQVHHIIPRGLYAMYFHNLNWDVNNPSNGITLCAKHHVGKDEDPNIFPSVHPDTEFARIAHRNGDKQSFNKMVENREQLNALGTPYWNTEFDWMFSMIVQKRNAAFPHNFPARSIPDYSRTLP